MTPILPSRFTRAEKISDAVVHLVAIALAVAAVPILIWLGVARRGDWVSVAGVSIYGATLLTMLTASAIYNMTKGGPRSPIYKRIDHSAIYLKIAGTYTPLVALTGGGGLPLLAALWGAALGGSSLKIAAPDRLRWLGLALYLVMGWWVVVAGWDVLDALTPVGFWLIFAGGALYTFGVPFYLWDRLPFHTAIWHGFVVVATALIYAAILIEVIRTV